MAISMVYLQCKRQGRQLLNDCTGNGVVVVALYFPALVRCAGKYERGTAGQYRTQYIQRLTTSSVL